MQLNFDPDLNLARFQWFTPEWAALELVDRFFPDLTSADLVLEPSAGLGAFLKAIPEEVPALGVELDPAVAERCRQNTSREVITGDFCEIDLPPDITQVIGNPPFQVAIINRFLGRCNKMPELRRCGFLLPAYAVQTHRTVYRWMQRWNLRVELVPRRLFPRLRLPLLFVIFSRGKSREVVGFCLYEQAVQFDNMSELAKEVLINGRPKVGVWRALVTEVLTVMGGEAEMEQIYRAVEPRRPTPNPWWKEKIRQTLQRYCSPLGRGRWKLRTAEAI